MEFISFTRFFMAVSLILIYVIQKLVGLAHQASTNLKPRHEDMFAGNMDVRHLAFEDQLQFVDSSYYGAIDDLTAAHNSANHYSKSNNYNHKNVHSSNSVGAGGCNGGAHSKKNLNQQQQLHHQGHHHHLHDRRFELHNNVGPNSAPISVSYLSLSVLLFELNERQGCLGTGNYSVMRTFSAINVGQVVMKVRGFRIGHSSLPAIDDDSDDTQHHNKQDEENEESATNEAGVKGGGAIVADKAEHQQHHQQQALDLQNSCHGYGFTIYDCQPFDLQPNHEHKIRIAFTPDFTLTKTTVPLTILTNVSGELKFALVATIPRNLLVACNQSLPRPDWESTMHYLLAAGMVIIITCSILIAYLEAKLYPFPGPKRRAHHHHSPAITPSSTTSTSTSALAAPAAAAATTNTTTTNHVSDQLVSSALSKSSRAQHDQQQQQVSDKNHHQAQQQVSSANGRARAADKNLRRRRSRAANSTRGESVSATRVVAAAAAAATTAATTATIATTTNVKHGRERTASDTKCDSLSVRSSIERPTEATQMASVLPEATATVTPRRQQQQQQQQQKQRNKPKPKSKQQQQQQTQQQQQQQKAMANVTCSANTDSSSSNNNNANVNANANSNENSSSSYVARTKPKANVKVESERNREEIAVVKQETEFDSRNSQSLGQTTKATVPPSQTTTTDWQRQRQRSKPTRPVNSESTTATAATTTTATHVTNRANRNTATLATTTTVTSDSTTTPNDHRDQIEPTLARQVQNAIVVTPTLVNSDKAQQQVEWPLGESHASDNNNINSNITSNNRNSSSSATIGANNAGSLLNSLKYWNNDMVRIYGTEINGTAACSPVNANVLDTELDHLRATSSPWDSFSSTSHDNDHVAPVASKASIKSHYSGVTNSVLANSVNTNQHISNGHRDENNISGAQINSNGANNVTGHNNISCSNTNGIGHSSGGINISGNNHSNNTNTTANPNGTVDLFNLFSPDYGPNWIGWVSRQRS